MEQVTAGSSLAGQVGLVTGAASGIGRASALALADAGARVAVADLDPDGGQETVSLIEAAGGEAFFIRADVADEASVEAMVAAVVQRFGRLDAAHNNAGTESPFAEVADCSFEEWSRSISVNLTGVWLCMRAELRQMLGQGGGGGAIVNTSSVAGITSTPGNAGYSAAKHGVIGLTKAAAVEYAMRNIRINAVCPGLTRTAMTDRLVAAVPHLVEAILPPMQRFAQPPEIAAMVAFLLSSQASYLTGQAVVIDGGATAA